MYEKIAARMVEAGFGRNVAQCRDNKAKGEYKKDNNKEAGQERKTWKLFDSMNDILGNKPATQPTIVIDSLQEASPEELMTLQKTNTVLDVEEDRAKTEK